MASQSNQGPPPQNWGNSRGRFPTQLDASKIAMIAYQVEEERG